MSMPRKLNILCRNFMILYNNVAHPLLCVKVFAFHSQSHAENTCMTAPFSKDGGFGIVPKA